MTDLLVVGGGKMGEALIGGLLRSGWPAPADLAVAEPDASRRAELAAAFPGIAVSEAPVVAAGAIIAVKPQHALDVCRQLGTLGIPRILSIAAGVRVSSLEAQLPGGTAVVRAMPNTPALVGAGAAAIAGGTSAAAEDLDWAEAMLGAVGSVVRVDEAQMDAVTGVSGSGPAYVFLLAEALIDAGVAVGLDHQTATDLVVQTIRGAGELLATGQPPSLLREAVTSPGGTTAAGLAVLESADLRGTVAATVAAAAARSAELG